MEAPIVKSSPAPEFVPSLISIAMPTTKLDAYGRIKFYHQLTMEAGKVSIAAALMTGLELMKLRHEHCGSWTQYCEDHLPIGYQTCNRYITAVEKTLGKGRVIDDLVHTTDQVKLEVVAQYTKDTNYQSRYEIYRGEGIVKKSNLGGAGRGQGRKSNEEKARLALAAEAAAHDGDLAAKTVEGLLADLYRVIIIEGALGDLETDKLEGVSKALENLYKKSVEAVGNRHSQLLKKKL